MVPLSGCFPDLFLSTKPAKTIKITVWNCCQKLDISELQKETYISLFTKWLDSCMLFYDVVYKVKHFLKKVSACWKKWQNKTKFSSIEVSQGTKSQQQHWSHVRAAVAAGPGPHRRLQHRAAPLCGGKHCWKHQPLWQTWVCWARWLISSSSLWVSWPAGGTGCRSCCPRWPWRRERRRWEEAWSSPCHFLDHPEWGRKKVEVNNHCSALDCNLDEKMTSLNYL